MKQIKEVFGLVLSSIIIIAVLSGCATNAPVLNTSTGKPEIVINAVSKEDVFNAIAEEMLVNDYFLKSRSDSNNIAIFSAKGQYSGGGNIFMEIRVTYNLIDIPNGTQVMATILEYDYPGTDKEVLWRDHSRGSWWANSIQGHLASVKNKLEQKPVNQSQNISQNNPPAQTVATEERRIIIDIVGMMIVGKNIVSVIADGPADKAGIKKGDLIVTIDGEPAGAGEQNALRLAGAGKANTSVLLKIKRADQELVVPVIRENP